MEKKFLGLVMVGMFLGVGSAFGITFGDSFWGGGYSIDGYIPIMGATESQRYQPCIPEGPVMDWKGPGDAYQGEVIELQGPFKGGGVVLEDPPIPIFKTGILVDNAKAIEYLENLREKLPADQQKLLDEVIALIKNTKDAKVEVMLFPTGENTLGMTFDVFKETTVEGKPMRESLSSATIYLKAEDKATVEGIMKDFGAIVKEKDSAKQKQMFDTLFKDKISKLAVEGSKVSKIVKLDPKKDAAEIKKRVDAAYDYLVKNGLKAEADKLRAELNKTLADAKEVTLKELYRNGKLSSSSLTVVDKAGEVKYSVIVGYDEKGKVISANIIKHDAKNNKSESAYVYTQAGIPEGMTAEQDAKAFFKNYGIEDPAKQFGKTWEELLKNWGKWTIATYSQETFDRTTGVTTGSVKLIFIHGTTKIELPVINYKIEPPKSPGK